MHTRTRATAHARLAKEHFSHECLPCLLLQATTWVERESLKEYRSAGFKFNLNPADAVMQNFAKMREAVASRVGELKLPALPAMPELPFELPKMPQLPQLPGRKQPADALAAAARFRPAFIPGRVAAMPKRRAAVGGAHA